MNEIIAEYLADATKVTDTEPNKGYDEVAMFYNENDHEGSDAFMGKNGAYGTHPIVLTKADIDRLQKGGEMIVWGQGEYSVIIFYRESLP